jgi:glycosyltransferase involved in cell wall biosynthesis
LNPSGQLGGAERMLLDILASMREAVPEWRLHLVVSEQGPLVDRASALGVPVTLLPFPTALARIGDAGAGGPAGRQVSRLALLHRLLASGWSAIPYLRRLRRVLRALSPDVIHTNGFKMHVLGLRACPTRRTPVIWHIHDYTGTRPVMARLLRRYAARPAAAIANSRSVAEDVRLTCGQRLDVYTIYNGIDLKDFAPTGPVLDPDALSGLPPSAPGTIKVGMLATLARWKGHETFLRAMALVPPDLPVRGYVASGALYRTDGSQHSLEELKSLIDKLGISRRIGLTGFVSHPASLMRALDIIIHASTQPEPFGLVIAEGMACGRAVIASHTGGASELIDAEVNGLAHPPGDAEKLAERITELATNPQLRSRLGTAGRATAEQRFDRTRLATELIPIYRKVISGCKMKKESGGKPLFLI